MGLLDKVLGTVTDVAQVAAPVVDIFAPGVGTVIQQGATVADQLGFSDGAISELSSAADFVGPIHNVIGGLATGGGLGGAGGGLSGLGGVLGSVGGALSPFIAGAAEKGISGDALQKYNELELANLGLMVDANYAADMRAYEQAVANQQAAQAAAAARAAAARETEANRQRALKRSTRVKRKSSKRASRLYDPYHQAGLDVLPVHTNLTKLGGELGNALYNTAMTPPARVASYDLIEPPTFE